MNRDNSSSASASAYEFTYDQVPYPILTFSQTHPDMLSTMGRFFGMKATDPKSCRLLEIGCGSGANLLSMAYTLPGSRFEGIDLSAVHIDDAQKAAKELEISNAKFAQADITELVTDKVGKFDYIVAHGVYSWVPDVVRRSILRIYSECLAENGIGFISYNTYPGCHTREMVWEPMRYHVEAIEPWTRKVEEGKKFLAALVNSAERDSVFQSIVLQELKRIIDKPAEVVFHDDLERTNQPFYFHQFIADARTNGLKFLAEANPMWLNVGGLSPDVQGFLRSLESNVERREQYLDFIRCDRFRNTLLCRDTVDLAREPDVETFKKYFIAAELDPVSESEDINSIEPKKFAVPDGPTLSIDHPLTKAVFVCLGKRWPHRIAFTELIDEASGMIDETYLEDSSEETKTAVKCLIGAFRSGIVKLHSYRPAYTETVSKRPRANPFARWQIRSGSTALAILTEPIPKRENDLVEHLIPLLDGTRDHAELAEDIKKIVSVPPEQTEEFNKRLPELVEANLRTIADAGLLIE